MKNTPDQNLKSLPADFAKYDFTKLSEAEMKAVIYMRELVVFQEIKIKLDERNSKRVKVWRHETLLEDFPHRENA